MFCGVSSCEQDQGLGSSIVRVIVAGNSITDKPAATSKTKDEKVYSGLLFCFHGDPCSNTVHCVRERAHCTCVKSECS